MLRLRVDFPPQTRAFLRTELPRSAPCILRHRFAALWAEPFCDPRQKVGKVKIICFHFFHICLPPVAQQKRLVFSQSRRKSCEKRCSFSSKISCFRFAISLFSEQAKTQEMYCKTAFFPVLWFIPMGLTISAAPLFSCVMAHAVNHQTPGL